MGGGKRWAMGRGRRSEAVEGLVLSETITLKSTDKRYIEKLNKLQYDLVL